MTLIPTKQASAWMDLQTVEARRGDEIAGKLDLHVERLLICGDCGVRLSAVNTCSGCGGYAQPAVNQQLVDKMSKKG